MISSSQETRTHFLAQVEMELSSQKVKDPFTTGKDIVELWAEDKMKAQLPKDFGANPLGVFSSGRFTFRVAQTENLFASRFSQTDSEGRLWMVDTALFRAAQGKTFMGMNLSYRACIGTMMAGASVPNFIPLMQDEIGLISDGIPVVRKARVIDSRQSALALSSLIFNKGRRKPVVVFSTNLRGEPFNEKQPSPDAFANRAFPLANTFLINQEGSLGFKDKHGQEWGVFAGGVRVYLPGADAEQDDCTSHPLYIRRHIESWNGGKKRCEAALFDDLARKSVAGHLMDRVPSFEKLQREVASEAVITLSMDHHQQVNSLTRQVQALTEERDALDDRVASLEEELANARAANEALVAERTRLFAALEQRPTRCMTKEESLVEEWRRLGTSLTREMPKNYESLGGWVDENLADRLVVLPKALRGAKKSNFSDARFAYQCLLLLGVEYKEMKTEGTPESRERFEERLKEMRIEISPTFDGKKPAGGWEDSYYASYEGKRYAMDLHLKKSNSRSPEKALRVYFFYDEKSKRPVIGHVFSHLDCRLS